MCTVRFVASLLFVTASAWADSQVLFDSDSGDFIGPGHQVIYSSGITVSAHGGKVEVDISDKSTRFTLEFEVPNNVKTFAVGNYANAERAAFRSPMRPGLDISGDGRGCNTLTGWFRVLQAQFDNSGSIQNLAINFKQNCEGGSEALFGAVRINSSLPLNVKGPFAIAGSPVEAVEGENVTLNGGQSFKRDGTSLKYMWLQQSGPQVQLRGSTSATPSFSAPTGLPLGGAVLVFELKVTDGISYADNDTVQVKVYSKSDQHYYIALRSQAHDHISDGQHVTYGSDITVSTHGGKVRVDISDKSTRLTLEFEVPENIKTFDVGNYTNAECATFRSPMRPGLEIHGYGRGCNTLTGLFRVLQADFDNSGRIQNLAINFKQNCEGGSDMLVGAVRINSSLPINVKGPFAIAGSPVEAIEGANVILNGSQSFKRDGTSLKYMWLQKSGPRVQLRGSTSATPSFTAPTGLPLGGAVLEFELEVTDGISCADTDTVQVKVYSKSDRQNYIEFRSQAHDYIGNGQYYRFNSTNTHFRFSGSQSGVHISLSSSDSWTIDMVPASGSTFKVGDYEGAERYPFQAAGKPGLSVSGNGRGCNTLTGRFNVTVAETDSIKNIIAFGAEFEQHCEGSTDALLGTIRYNCLDPHVPNALAGAYQVVNPGQTVTLDGSGSSDPMKNSISYQWNQIEGPKVMLHNYSSPKPTFVAPPVTSSQHLVFSLLVTNNLGYISSAVTQVIINPVLNSSSNSK